jgi:hypothetical protein
MTHEKEQIENFSFRGTWWLPEAPEEKVSGTLSFDSDEGVTLDLERPLEPNVFTHPLKQKQLNRPALDPRRYFGPPLILGHHDDGHLCTVFGAIEESHAIGAAGIVRVKYGGSALALGVGVDDADEIFVKAIQFRCTNLEAWFGHRPFGGGHKDKTEDIDYTVTYRYPETFSAPVHSHGFAISTNSILSTSSLDGSPNIHLVHHCPLRIEFDDPHTIEDAVNLAIEVKRVLTLMMDFPAYFLQVQIETGESDDHFPITLYFAQPHRRTKEIFEQQMLLPFSAVRDRFSAILSGWLDRAVRLRAVYELLETIFFGPKISVEVALLTLTQAFETFHRDQIGGTYTDAATYESFRTAMVTAIPQGVGSDHREALKSRLRFGNNYSMRKRIDLSLKSLGEDVVKVITRNPGAFSKRIADTRNYLTHRDDLSKGEVVPEPKLFVATEKFRYFLVVLMMQVLGVPPAETVAALSQEYRRAAVLKSDVV